MGMELADDVKESSVFLNVRFLTCSAVVCAVIDKDIVGVVV